MITQERVHELKRYVGLSSEDSAHLIELRKRASPHFPRIARNFYEKVREHEEAHAVFSGEAQIERLHRSMEAWLARLLGGVYDVDYYEKTARIGEVHVRVGLPQRYMFTAMALIRLDLEAIAEDDEPEKAKVTTRALHRVLDLDLAVMLEAYHDAYLARSERRNVIEKEELAASLARTERRYTTAVELTQELVVGLDHDNAVRLFNSSAERVTGFGREEVIGQSFAETFLDPADRATFAKVVASAQDSSPSVDCAIRTRAGRVRDIRWQIASTTVDGERGVDGIDVFLIGTDETDARELARRTQQSERLASIGTLAAGLAHEIRNPLNGAQLHVSYLTRALGKMEGHAELVEAAHVVGDEIKRLAALVTEFLDFARPKPLAKTDVGLVALCDRVLPLLAPAARAAQVTIVTDYPQKDIIVSGDPAKLEQVMLNVAQNAVEALAANGGGHVHVRVRRQPKFATLEIEDDGPGLPSPDAPIYDAFYSTKPNGTGLGLAITHRIITDHGGTIDARSKAGCTVFRITLPIEHQGAWHE